MSSISPKSMTPYSTNTMTSTHTTRPPLTASANNWSQKLDQLLHGDFEYHETLQSLLVATGLPGHLALRAPIAVAASLNEYPALLTQHKPVRIAVLGAETRDAGADGRLFGLVRHALATKSLQVEVELVGPQLTRALTCSKSVDAIFPPAKLHRGTCGSWWKEARHDRRPDLVFIFHPGLESHASHWMKGLELPRVLSSGIPLIVFSFDLDEAHRDAHILESFGAQIVAAPKLFQASNPAGIDALLNPLESFASATFTVAGFKRKPVKRAKVVVQQVRTLSSVMLRIFQEEGYSVRHSDAFQPRVMRRYGNDCNVLHIISDKYFDPATTEIFEARDGDELASSRTIAAPNLAALLPTLNSDLTRALVAAEIYTWFLE